MAMILKALYTVYRKANEDYSDPRTNDWFLVGGPWAVFAVLGFYHYFVHRLGPALMEHRKPFNVDRLIQIYNAVQVLLCSWLVVESIIHCYGPTGKYKWLCEPVDYSNDPQALLVAKFVWLYYMLKVMDLLDTVFFILRKKNSQVTFLHVYHHTGMVLVGWGGTKYLAGGHGVFMGMINSFVHVVMYSYYFLTNYNPEYKKKLWWKKYITQLQMFQFLCIIIHFTIILFQPTCEYPIWAVLIFLPQNFFMLILFWDFYKKAYIYPKKAVGKDTETSEISENSTIKEKTT